MRWRHLTILLWIALFLALAEIALEYRAYRRGWETIVFGVQEPEAPAREGDASAVRYGTTEDFPYRSRVLEADAARDVPLVWVASASYALGANVAARQTFPVVLEERLRAAGATANVINAGRAGHAIHHNIADLRSEGSAWKPDFLVLYTMSTDIDELTRYILEPSLAVSQDAEKEDGGPWFNPRKWMELTTTYPLLKEHLSSRVTKARVLCKSLGDEGARRFRARVEDFLALAEEIDATPILCTFAVSHTRDNPEDLPLHVFRFNIRLGRAGWHDSLDRWNAILKDLAVERGVPLADVRAAVDGRADAFVDFLHFTVEGHEQVADVLSSTLAPAVKAWQAERAGR